MDSDNLRRLAELTAKINLSKVSAIKLLLTQLSLEELNEVHELNSLLILSKKNTTRKRSSLGPGANHDFSMYSNDIVSLEEKTKREHRFGSNSLSESQYFDITLDDMIISNKREKRLQKNHNCNDIIPSRKRKNWRNYKRDNAVTVEQLDKELDEYMNS